MSAFRSLLLLGIGGFAFLADAAEPIDIGSRLEPFVDEHLIEKLDGVELELHRPVPREVVLVCDRPWEGNVCAYYTVFRDDHPEGGDLFRMYYRGAHYDEKTRKSTHEEVYCYAESRDGIRWTRPELGIVEFEGSKKNNIVLRGIGSHNFAPFADTNPECDPEARYKALGSGRGGLWAFQSPDGIHWKLMREGPVITEGAFDSQNLAFWDSHRGRYVDFHRDFRHGVRDIKTCTSADFIAWTDPDWIEYPGVPPEHLYTNAIVAYHRAPHIFIGFPKRLLPKRNPAKHPYPGVSDGVFMSSRDGKSFRRWREAFIRPGLQIDRWVNRNNMTAWGVLQTASSTADNPDELSFYSTEGYYRGAGVRLRRYTTRLDGFVSVHANAKGGEMRTKLLTFAPGRKHSGRNLAPGPAASTDEDPIFGERAIAFREPAVLSLPGTEDLGTEATLAVHVRGLPAGHRRLFSSYDGGDWKPRELYFDVGASEEHSLRFGYDGETVAAPRGSIGDLSDGKVHHLAATWKRGAVELFVDGESVAKGIIQGRERLVSRRGDLRFAEDYPPTSLTNEPLLGVADDVLVLRRALSTTEIALVAQKGARSVIRGGKDSGVLLEGEIEKGDVRTLACALDGRPVSLPGPPGPGEVELVVNYSTSAAGSIRCEILDEQGEAIPGYSLDDSTPLYGDEVEGVLRWRESSEVKPLVGRPVRLRFLLEDADLFSLRCR